MTRAAGTRPDDSAWGAEVLRFTFFHPPGKAPDMKGTWKVLTKQDPEVSNAKPKTGDLTEGGEYSGSKLFLKAQPGRLRVDWVLHSEETQQKFPAAFSDRAALFRNLVNDWLGNGELPPATRLAFGAVLLHKVTDFVEGYHLLSKYLNFDIPEDIVSDFFYQANRWRTSKTDPGIKINRLIKWTIEDAKVISVEALMDGQVVSGTNLSSEPLGPSGRIELDINTVPQPDLLIPSNKLRLIFGELVELGREIIREGDIA